MGGTPPLFRELQKVGDANDDSDVDADANAGADAELSWSTS